jgi:predicted helicase
LRERRGVYYTPEPVVSYLVRSVDYLLKTRFGCANGLADTATVGYEREEESGGKLKKVKATSPRVLILDPACGTGTFLYTVIDHIRQEFMRQGNAGMWSGYVRNHLLPRIFGFELLMAPYAVAHFKLGMQLAGHDLTPAQREKWAYDFTGNERLGVYLTNTLEEAEQKAETLFGPLRVISQEANAALKIKSELPILAIMGNPPYSGSSANRSHDKEGNLTFIGRLIQDYRTAEGQPLAERNPKMLQDDYVKFIRFAQSRIDRTGYGILAFITNHSYLDNPTFRGMRESLMHSFSEIFLCDLHGNARKGEKAPDGGHDGNVFDIQQGVAVIVAVKQDNANGRCRVYHTELWGRREDKYSWLWEANISRVPWRPLTPEPPSYLFTPQDRTTFWEYDRSWKLTDAMPLSSSCMNTARDAFVIDIDSENLSRRIGGAFSSDLDPAQLAESLGLEDTGWWKFSEALSTLRETPAWQNLIIKCLYRPFDSRWIFHHPAFVDRPRTKLNSHMLQGNLSLVTTRQTKEPFAVLATNLVCGQHKIAAVYDRSYFFPLYIYRDGAQRLITMGKVREANFCSAFTADIEKRMGLSFVPDGKGDLQQTFGPEDIFNYIYAVFYSPTYRARYAEFLKTDFPRVPLTSDVNLFRSLCEFGGELVALHLLESPVLQNPIARYPVKGSNIVEKGFPQYVIPACSVEQPSPPLEECRVYINGKFGSKEAQYFECVPLEVWDFHIGGYQVCEKWLKDRRGRTLTYDDQKHYCKVVTAIKETIRHMAEIDAAIPKWPLE